MSQRKVVPMIDGAIRTGEGLGVMLAALLELFPSLLKRYGHSIELFKDVKSPRQYLVYCALDTLRADRDFRIKNMDGYDLPPEFSAEVVERSADEMEIVPCRIRCVAGIGEARLYLVLIASGLGRAPGEKTIESFVLKHAHGEARFRVIGKDGSCELIS